MKYAPPLDATDTNAPYVDGNPAAGIEGSIVPAASIEHPQREILAVITAAGLTPSATVLNQLWQAINKITVQALGEIDLSAYAKINSPTFTGSPAAPTPGASDNSTRLATTAFVRSVSNNYGHPTGSAASKGLGLYKFSTDSTSHISSVAGVAKGDITALGIPAQDTTYAAATTSRAGLMSAADKTKLDSLSGAGARAWQNVKSSRALGTTYTNSTGREIEVIVHCSAGGGTSLILTVDGVTMGYCYDIASYRDTVFASIPHGSTYKVTGGTLQTWMELR